MSKSTTGRGDKLKTMAMDELDERYVSLHMRIVEECLCHANETGYLSLKVDDNYYLVENSLRFVKGAFDKDEFPLFDKDIPEGVTVKDAFFIYFSIRRADNIRLNFRKLILQVDNF